MKTTEEIKEELRKKVFEPVLTDKDFVSTGSTLLNLAISGNPYWGFAKGKFYQFVGDSTSGKTFFCLTCFAEASINPNFEGYRFIFDDIEGGALMDIRKFFGKTVAEKIEAPRTEKGEPIYSATVEDFYYNVDDAIQEGKPFIYVLDSMDALSSRDEDAKFEQMKKAHRKNKETTGSVGDGKAKKNSGNIRKLLKGLRKTKSILIIIGQTRDKINIGWAARFDPETKSISGGRSLKFYATLQMWSSVQRKITKEINGKKRELGTYCKVQIKKNRITGKDRSIVIPIYHSVGIDDLGSCVDFLLEEFHWKKKKGLGNGIMAEDLGLKGSREQLVHKIEKKGYEKDLIAIVKDVWDKIEKQCEIIRKPKYG